MVKCPQCLQLRDDGDLPCPHCGEVPYGVRNRPSQRIADDPAPAKPRAEPKSFSFGGMDLDLGDASASGLDLAGDDDAPTAEVPKAGGPALPALQLDPLDDVPKPKRAPVVQLPASAFQPSPEEVEARRIADYGEPSAGPIGAVRYFWRVSMRRSDLNRRRAEAKETLDGLEREMTSRFAELGLAAEAASPSEHEPRAGFVRAARSAEQHRDEEAHLSATVEAEHRARLEELRARLAALGRELEPLAETAAAARKRLDELRTDVRRTEAVAKRAEIERRNVVELIAKRQEAFAEPETPADEREKLLAEIAELDRRSPDLNERVDSSRAKLEALAQPLAAAQAEHDEAQRLVADKRRIADEVAEKLEAAELDLEAERAKSGQKHEAADREVAKAWAAVGENVLPTVQRDGSSPLAPLARAAAELSEKVEDATARLARLQRAITCFDHDAYAQGRTYAIIGGAIAVVLLTILIVIIIS